MQINSSRNNEKKNIRCENIITNIDLLMCEFIRFTYIVIGAAIQVDTNFVCWVREISIPLGVTN